MAHIIKYSFMKKIIPMVKTHINSHGDVLQFASLMNDEALSFNKLERINSKTSKPSKSLFLVMADIGTCIEYRRCVF